MRLFRKKSDGESTQERVEEFSGVQRAELSAFDLALAENRAKIVELTSVIESRRRVLQEEVTPPIGIPTAELISVARRVVAKHGADCEDCRELARLIGHS